MPEPKTEAEAIAILIRNTLELYMQMEVKDVEIVRQDLAAMEFLLKSDVYNAFRVGDRYYIGEPA